MQRIGTVIERLDEKRILLEVERPSACGGDCRTCGSCSGNTSHIVAECREAVAPGEQVCVSISDHRYFLLSFLVFILPLGGMMIGYWFLVHWWGEAVAPWGALLLGAGIFVSVILGMRTLKMPHAAKEADQTESKQRGIL